MFSKRQPDLSKEAAAQRLRLADAQGYDDGWHGRDHRPQWADCTPEWRAYDRAYDAARLLSTIPHK